MNGPRYLQIADDLRRRMINGDYPPGAEIPSTTELMQHYGVSQNTVRNAVALLRNEGRLDVPGPGRPTTVRQMPPRIVRDANRHYELEKELALRGGLPADTHLAREMGLGDEAAEITPLGDEVIGAAGEIGFILGLEEPERIHRYSFLIGVAVLGDHRGGGARIAHHYYPEDLDERVRAAQPTGKIWPGGAYHQLGLLGIEPDEQTDELTARMPLPEERDMLGLSEGIPVLVIRKICHDTTRVAREVVDIVMGGDRAKAVYHVKLPAWGSHERPHLGLGDSDSE